VLRERGWEDFYKGSGDARGFLEEKVRDMGGGMIKKVREY
ncbi:hypothetical protein COM07_03905, partial [Bacillus toyonensis]